VFDLFKLRSFKARPAHLGLVSLTRLDSTKMYLCLWTMLLINNNHIFNGYTSN
jgi:hypothetical protein